MSNTSKTNLNSAAKPLSGTEITESYLTLEDVSRAVTQLLPNSSTALQLILAVALASQREQSTMLWLLLVGEPSSGKTDLVRLIKNHRLAFYQDTITQNSFISGERPTEKEKVHDLLPLLNNKCFVIKDWTSIFSLDERMTKKLLGDLVGIYDKEYSKFSSRRGSIAYESYFSHLGCITPATLNKHTQYMNMVGARFLMYSMPALTGADQQKSFEAIFSGQNRKAVEQHARDLTTRYLDFLLMVELPLPPLSEEAKYYLQLSAMLMANCRGIVMMQSSTFTNDDGKEVTTYEPIEIQIEQPWRAVQQLICLVQHIALVNDRSDINNDDLQIIKDVVISSMPADRSHALREIIVAGGHVTAKDLSTATDVSVKTSRRLLSELLSLRVLEKIQGAGVIATDYKICSTFHDYLLMDTREFLSHKRESEITIEDVEAVFGRRG